MGWILGNRFLSYDEMKQNAMEIYGYLFNKGWTLQAISGILGNMQSESSINPHIWEGLREGNMSGGYGLVQWTPASKYINWAGSNWRTPERELDRLIYEEKNGLQWFANPQAPVVNPPMTFHQWTRAKYPPVDMANMFLWYYEHPAVTIQPQRGQQANDWFKFISGKEPPEGGGGVIGGNKIPIWLLFKMSKGA